MRKFTLFFALIIAVLTTAKAQTFEVIDLASNADAMLYTNAPCTNTQWGDQFVGWYVLFDDDAGTFLHTEYGNNGKSVDDLDHYIRVDLGEGNEISAFKFNYTTRTGTDADYPQNFIVTGSNDDATYTEIGRIESGLPSSAGQVYESDLFESATAYRYLRFMVTLTNTNRKASGVQHNYWHIAEFGISKLLDANGNGEAKAALLAAIENLDTYVIGENFGEYSSSDADYATKVQAIKDYYAAIEESTAVSEINAKVDELNALLATLVQNVELVVGKYYVFNCPLFKNQIGVYSTGTNARWKTYDAEDESFIWTVELTTNGGKVFKSVAANKYLLGATNNETLWSLVETAAGAEVTLIPCGSGQFHISINGRHMHAADHGGGNGTEGRIVSWETNEVNSASAWKIVEVDYVTAIEGVNAEAEDVVIYDLTGRRIAEIAKPGIYIVNGKKVLVK